MLVDCPTCKQILKLENHFYPDSTKPNGYTWDCKKCYSRRVYRAKLRRQGKMPPKQKRIMICEESILGKNYLALTAHFDELKSLETLPPSYSIRGKLEGSICGDCEVLRVRSFNGGARVDVFLRRGRHVYNPAKVTITYLAGLLADDGMRILVEPHGQNKIEESLNV